MMMASGITVLFRRNFGFLLSPFTVPIEGVASAIAQRMGTNQQTNEAIATPPENQNQMEMFNLQGEIENQDNQINQK